MNREMKKSKGRLWAKILFVIFLILTIVFGLVTAEVALNTSVYGYQQFGKYAYIKNSSSESLYGYSDSLPRANVNAVFFTENATNAENSFLIQIPNGIPNDLKLKAANRNQAYIIEIASEEGSNYIAPNGAIIAKSQVYMFEIKNVNPVLFILIKYIGTSYGIIGLALLLVLTIVFGVLKSQGKKIVHSKNNFIDKKDEEILTNASLDFNNDKKENIEEDIVTPEEEKRIKALDELGLSNEEEDLSHYHEIVSSDNDDLYKNNGKTFDPIIDSLEETEIVTEPINEFEQPIIEKSDEESNLKFEEPINENTSNIVKLNEDMLKQVEKLRTDNSELHTNLKMAIDKLELQKLENKKLFAKIENIKHENDSLNDRLRYEREKARQELLNKTRWDEIENQATEKVRESMMDELNLHARESVQKQMLFKSENRARKEISNEVSGIINQRVKNEILQEKKRIATDSLLTNDVSDNDMKDKNYSPSAFDDTSHIQKMRKLLDDIEKDNEN